MYRIVVADDSRTIQKVVQLSLEGEEFQAEIFSEGQEALEHLERFGADLVLADSSLPGLDGYELCRRLRRNPRTAECPVVLLAGSLEVVDPERARAEGFSAVLSKPFETSKLLSLLTELVESDTGREIDSDDAAKERLPAAVEADGDFGEEPVMEEENLFDLSRRECRPRFSLLPVRRWRARPVSVEELSEEQYQKLIRTLSERLPETVRQLLPDVTRSVLKD